MKNKRLNFRISDEEDAAIRAKAEAANLSITDYVIAAATKKEIISYDGLPDLVTQVKRLGNNLNQLAVMARQNRIQAVYLEDACRELQSIYDLLAVALRRR